MPTLGKMVIPQFWKKQWSFKAKYTIKVYKPGKEINLNIVESVFGAEAVNGREFA
jgi:hypothetical protein